VSVVVDAVQPLEHKSYTCPAAMLAALTGFKANAILCCLLMCCRCSRVGGG
jgi:hypothetical protein